MQGEEDMEKLKESRAEIMALEEQIARVKSQVQEVCEGAATQVAGEEGRVASLTKQLLIANREVGEALKAYGGLASMAAAHAVMLADVMDALRGRGEGERGESAGEEDKGEVGIRRGAVSLGDGGLVAWVEEEGYWGGEGGIAVGDVIEKVCGVDCGGGGGQGERMMIGVGSGMINRLIRVEGKRRWGGKFALARLVNPLVNDSTELGSIADQVLNLWETARSAKRGVEMLQEIKGELKGGMCTLRAQADDAFLTLDVAKRFAERCGRDFVSTCGKLDALEVGGS